MMFAKQVGPFMKIGCVLGLLGRGRRDLPGARTVRANGYQLVF